MWMFSILAFLFLGNIANADSDGFYIGPSLGYYFFDEAHSRNKFDNTLSYGFTLGYQINNNFAIEGSHSWLNAELTHSIYDQDGKYHAFGEDADFGLTRIDAILGKNLYFALGYASLNSDFLFDNDDKDIKWNLGFGYKANLNPSLSFIFDARAYPYKNDRYGNDSEYVADYSVNLGFVYRFGAGSTTTKTVTTKTTATKTTATTSSVKHQRETAKITRVKRDISDIKSKLNSKKSWLSENGNIYNSDTGECKQPSYGPKPETACSPSEQDEIATALCASVMGGCEVAQRLSGNSSATEKFLGSQACGMLVAKFKDVPYDLKDALENFFDDQIGEAAGILLKSDGVLNKIAGGTAAWFHGKRKIDQFQECVDEAGSKCSDLYDEWNKPSELYDSCVDHLKSIQELEKSLTSLYMQLEKF